MSSARDAQSPNPSESLDPLVIPSELWLEIIGRLEAKDTLSLSSTCRNLNLLLTERITWILILRSVCREHGVYFPSYDVDTMDVGEIRSAAMGRYRWGWLLEQNCLGPEEKALDSPPALQPTSGPTNLPSNLTDGTDLDLNYGPASVLIPGGRYLVLAHLRFVRLLDLGSPCRPPLLTPLEVAKVALISPFEDRQLVHLLAWEYESGWLRVAVGMEPDNGLSYAAKVYAVSPTEPNPQFRPIGSIVATAEEPSKLWQIQVHQNLLRVTSEVSGGIVWAFESGRYIPVPTFQHAEDVDHEVFTGDFIARFMSDALHMWPVPSVHSKVPPSGQVLIPRRTEPIYEEMTFPYPFRDPTANVNTEVLYLLPHGQPNMSFPITLDVYPSDPSISIKSSRYSVDVKRRDPESPCSIDVTFAVKTTYALPSHLRNLELVNHTDPLDLGQSSRTLVDVYLEGGRVYHSVLSVPNPPRLDSQSSRGVDGRSTGMNVTLTILYMGLGVNTCQLCSASGRLVYMERKGRSHEVFVVDYLST